MGSANRGGTRRYARIFASLAVALVLVGCGGLGLLPYRTDVQNTKFRSYKQVSIAYDHIMPGFTRVSDLNDIGFDTTSSPNVEALSYLGIVERFMPRDSVKFDKLDPSVRSCIDARDHCTALVFRPERLHREHAGNWFLDVLGFKRTAVNYGWSAEVVLLIQDGRVAYKAMSGRPNIQDDRVSPMVSFEDMGAKAMRTVARAASL
ncbi:MAG: hypothetical protein JSR55_08290 [Proteobacteria bacterium]|nr:hypothetical protein [Pseudomonadota bacterium]